MTEEIFIGYFIGLGVVFWTWIVYFFSNSVGYQEGFRDGRKFNNR